MKSKTIKVGVNQLLNIEDIYQAEADINYTMIHLFDGKKILVAKTLKKIQSELSESRQFFRINKSVIINLNNIATVQDKQITLKNGNVFNPSRRRTKHFLEVLEANLLI